VIETSCTGTGCAALAAAGAATSAALAATLAIAHRIAVPAPSLRRIIAFRR
jgi:hypothetical protein